MKHYSNFTITQEKYKKIYIPNLNGELIGVTRDTWETDTSLDHFKTASDYRLKISLGTFEETVIRDYDKVYLILTSEQVLQSTDFLGGHSVDGKKLIIDVTKHVLTNKTQTTFNLSSNNSTTRTFLKEGENAPYLLFKNNGVKESFAKLPLVDKATDVVRMQDGEMKVGAELISAQDSVHGVGVDYVLSSEGFTLSLNESFDGKEWVDVFGQKKELKTAYYYKKNGGRIYVKPFLVEEQSDGSYTYTVTNKIYKVIKEQYFEDGTIAITETKDVKNAALIDNRSDELKQVQEQIRRYENTVEDLIVWKWENREEFAINSSTIKFDLKDKKSLLEIQQSLIDKVWNVLTEGEFLQLKNAIEEKREDWIIYYENLINNHVGDLIAIFKEYYALKEKEKEIIRNTPVNFIKNGDSFKGFNEAGELIVLFKLNGVYVSINRDKDGKIVSLSDEKENAVIFNYEEDKLAYITDVRGRNVFVSNETVTTTENEVEVEKELTTITYQDGSDLTISLQENESAKIINFEKDSIKAILECSTDNKFKKATRYNGSEVIDFADLTIADGLITFDNFDKSKEVYRLVDGVVDSEYLLKGGIVVQALKQREEIDVETGLKTSKTVTYASQDSLYSIIENVLFTGDSQKDEFDKNGNALKTTTIAAGQEVVIERTFNEQNQCLKEVATITIYKEGETETEKEVVSEYVAITEHSYNAQGLKVKTVSYVVGEELINGKTVEEWVYNEQGALLKAFTYNTLDSSSKFYTSEPIYNEKGEQIGALDQTGEHKTEVEYVDKTSLVKTQKSQGSTTFAYGYDLADRVTSISQSPEGGEENSTQRVYENGLLTKLISGKTLIEYEYEKKRRIYTIKVNGVVEKTYEYSPDDKTITLIDKDGITWVTVKDDFGNVLSVSKNGVVIEQNTYEKGLLKTSVRDGVTTTYVYDSEQRLASKTVDGVTTTYTYDNYGNVTQITKEDEAITVYEYSQDSQHKLLAATESGFKTEIKTDASGRVVERKFTNVENNAFGTERITYIKKGDHTTNVPQSIVYANRIQSGMKDTLKYFYDARGNICQINENGKLLAKYTYDSLNRLIREDNAKLGKTYLFDYDGTGNITSKRECTFTLDKTESLTSFDKEQIATYNGDQLVYGLKSICTYSNGKVTRYDGKQIYFKQGGLISSFDNVIIAYDNYGRRRNKAGMSYTYNAKNLVVSQSNGISFIYDHKDQMVGIKNGTTPYYFRKNLQGDIVALLDSYGFVVVRYYYDAWGNHKVYNDSGVEITDTTHIGHLNPIRYRGYYYDTEFGLYYLKSRYYDPTVGRFISQDDVDYADYESIGGLNLYAYCNNNPVMFSDPTGHLPNWAKWLIGGVAFFGAVALTVVSGGSLAPVFIGMGISIASSALIEGGISAYNGEGFWSGFADGAADGAMWGGIFAFGGAALRTIKMFKNGVAIGENMKRVNNLARTGHQITYKGMPGFKFVKMFGGDDLARTLSMRHNQAFIERMMKWGVKIIDFGIDTSRNYRSFYYLMETIVSNGYGLLQLMY